MSFPAYARVVPGGLELRLKVVPGASRSAIAGELGDRLKVKVAAPPEDGKANAAVCAVLAQWLGAPVEVIAGHGNPLKTVLAKGVAAVPALTGARA